MSKTCNCIKCGGTNTMEALVAENSANPTAKIKMVRLVCSKCGFTELRIDQNDFNQAFGSPESKAEKD